RGMPLAAQAEDRDSRAERMHFGLGARRQPVMIRAQRADMTLSVMSNQIGVDRSNLVLGTEQVECNVPRQVAQVDELELPVPHEHANRLTVFGIIAPPTSRLGAVRFWLSGAGERFGNHLRAGANALHLDSLDRDHVARLDCGPSAFLYRREIGVVERVVS